ncbi:aldehyde dehydrogenase [Mycolicibacterium fortuitum]|uniref:aldehyde dehydrogenase n=1 Tax=Mycolicibacterium fortuitum TaxID=1766 RepID=UPI001CE2315A|nr:aldehyde dehydrogenase [Mycolicibacterium fortuitum]MCA4726879.1 aldehyde dehydrogenase [Mycolicibacterium fortuitum]
MQLTPRFYASQIKKTAETLDVPLPTVLVEQLDHADKVTHAAETMLNQGGDLNDAVLDAIEAGRDFHTDKTVQRLILERVLTNQGQGIADAARERSMQQKRAALVEHADDVLDEWAEVLAPHAAALAAAAEALPMDNLDDVRSVITRGLDAVEHWHNAQRAITMWSAAVQGFTGFADAARVRYHEHKALILTDADAATLEPAQQTARLQGSRHIDVWTLVRHGISLDLATVTEFRARRAAARAGDEPRAQQVANI